MLLPSTVNVVGKTGQAVNIVGTFLWLLSLLTNFELPIRSIMKEIRNAVLSFLAANAQHRKTDAPDGRFRLIGVLTAAGLEDLPHALNRVSFEGCFVFPEAFHARKS